MPAPTSNTSKSDIHGPMGGQPVDPYDRKEVDVFRLTPEEQRILKECSQEGIFFRAIPLGIIFGVGGLYGAKMGPLMSKSFGAKPAVIGLGLLGYFIGRFSYSKTCLTRALQVPDGNLRKMFPHLQQPSKEYFDAPDQFYTDVPTGPETNTPKQSSSMDINSYSSTNSIETVPSEYYLDTPEEGAEAEPKSYVSYDDLRRQNRQEYTNRFYAPRMQERQAPPVRRPQEEYPRNVNRQQTKYGDTWEA